MNSIFESSEQIDAVNHRSKEHVSYRGVLRVRNSGVKPVTLDLQFIPPHPFYGNMPETHAIQGKSITEVYVKLAKYFRTLGFEFGC